MRSKAWLPLLLLPLAACSSGGGGGGGGGDGSVTIPPDYLGRADFYDDTLGVIGADDPSPDYTEPSTLPQSGTAVYRGVMYIEDEAASTALLGSARLDVAFSGDDISGSATDFRDFDGVLHEGSLALTGTNAIDRGVVVEDEYTYSLDVAGTLDYPDDGAQSMEGRLNGDFFRGDAEYMFAESAGEDSFFTICDISDDVCTDEYAGVVARDTD